MNEQQRLAEQADSAARKLAKATKALTRATTLGYDVKELQQEIVERCAEINNIMICMMFH